MINNVGRYSGAYSRTLTITNFQIEDSGYYKCKVYGTNSIGADILLTAKGEFIFQILKKNSTK